MRCLDEPHRPCRYERTMLSGLWALTFSPCFGDVAFPKSISMSVYAWVQGPLARPVIPNRPVNSQTHQFRVPFSDCTRPQFEWRFFLARGRRNAGR